MRSHAAGFIICQILAQAERFTASFSTRNVANETIESYESRYQPNQHDYPDYGRQESDLAVSLLAPHYAARDYWRHKNGYDNRRTFLEDNRAPGFYQFMTSLFNGRDEVTDHFPYNPPTPPYPFETPFGFRPTEPNYIPPPKPIRASVIKLETITRSPSHPSFEYKTTPRYYPEVGTILNHVLIENSKTQRFGYHIPDFKPAPVLPKPVYAPPTTLKPSYFRVSNRTTLLEHNTTGYKYPESVQDQLPHFNVADVRIPYVPEKPIPQIFDTISTQTPTGRIRFPADDEVTTNVFGIDVRNQNSDITTLKSFPGMVERVKRPFKTKTTIQPEKSPVEMIANLTVQGLSKVERDNVNIHKYVNHFNMKNLISYEISKMENTSKPDVNLNDELSLDARILKDTNWDGVTIPMTTETTTTVQSKRTKDFWEILEKTTTKTTTTTNEPTTDDVDSLVTTTTEDSPTETTEPPTTDSTTTVRALKPRSDIVETTAVGTTTARRKYSRRPKILNFTPYPTPDELQKKVINRNNFPKRQKPNITLTFGNKNILRNTGTEEVMTFSDEDLRRRKIGKRRYRRKRISTSEPPSRQKE